MCRTRHDGNLCTSSIFSGASEWTTTLARPNYRRHLERSSARRFRHKRATCKCVRLLLLKLVQVLVAAEVGGHNRFVEMPRLSVSLNRACRHRQCTTSTLCAGLHIESVALVGVLVAAAVLVSSHCQVRRSPFGRVSFARPRRWSPSQGQ